MQNINSTKKIILIDGNALIYRAFYALPNLTTSKGMPVGAIYGFTMMLLKIIKSEKPDFIAATFDKGRAVKRIEKFASYKAQREKMPEDLSLQFPYIEKIVEALNIPIYWLEGHEADDCIATLAENAKKHELNVYIISGDKDLFQLVDKNVFMLVPEKTPQQFKIYNNEAVKERMGVTTEEIIDYRALSGDPSDNIPGVPGIGEKTAAKLISEYKNLEALYDNLDKISPKLSEKLIAHKEDAFLSREISKLQKDLPINFNLDEMKFSLPDNEKLIILLKELEFKALLKDFYPDNEEKNNIEVPFKLLNDENMAEELFVKILNAEKTAIYSPYMNSHIALTQNENIFVIDKTVFPKAIKLLSEIMKNPEIKKYIYDVKAVMGFYDEMEYEKWENIIDIKIADYLISPQMQDRSITHLSLKYLNQSVEKITQLKEHDNYELFAQTARAVSEIGPIVEKELESSKLVDLYNNIEFPLSKTLTNMEKLGIKIDVQKLEILSKQYKEELKNLQIEIFNLAGTEFNINSPKQLGEILFTKLSIPPVKKTKTGFSTDSDVLIKLAPNFPIAELIVKYRELSKLLSTYIDALPTLISPKTGRIHTTFNQTITATGRLSSSDPNLQNIPTRTPQGFEIRKAFIPSRDGFSFISADYSQIELRILAHLSKDSILLDTFSKDGDIHTRTAMEVFGCTINDINSNMRRLAKEVNFGIIYGMSEHGLSNSLKIPRKKAIEYINLYFDRYTGVKNYINECIEKTKNTGYSETILGRKRKISELLSQNFHVRQSGERMAVNTPIQGTAADVIKLAMLRVEKALENYGQNAQLILQIHDELIVEVKDSILNEIAVIVKNAMEDSVKLDVLLKTDIQSGKSWGNLEDLKM